MSIQSVARVIARYERTVMAKPEPAIWHHADCHVHGSHICTCGLLHDLAYLGADPTPIYADYYEEKAAQDLVLEVLRNTAPPPPGPQISPPVEPEDYFVLATVKAPESGQRERSVSRIHTFIDAVREIDLPTNRLFDTIDYWNGKQWLLSVLQDPRRVKHSGAIGS